MQGQHTPLQGAGGAGDLTGAHLSQVGNQHLIAFNAVVLGPRGRGGESGKQRHQDSSASHAPVESKTRAALIPRTTRGTRPNLRDATTALPDRRTAAAGMAVPIATSTSRRASSAA